MEIICYGDFFLVGSGQSFLILSDNTGEILLVGHRAGPLHQSPLQARARSPARAAVIVSASVRAARAVVLPAGLQGGGGGGVQLLD